MASAADIETAASVNNAPDANAPANDVKIEELGPARRRLTITIPAEAVKEKIEDSLGALLTETTLPGFRKGRAPRSLVERRFGTAVRTETRNQLIADAYSKAIEAHKIRPVGEPEPVGSFEDLKVEPGQALSFSLEVEVVPDFTMPELEGIDVKKPVLEITEEHVKEEMARQGREHGTAPEIEGPFVTGDRLIGHATVEAEGEEKPIFDSENVIIMVPEQNQEGRGPVLGLLIDDLDKKLKGKNIGDTVTIKTTGPEAHEREDIRGKDLTITFQIRRAQRVEPASVEQIVERYGLGTEENLRAQIRFALEQRRDVEQFSAMREQVAEYLLKEVDLELPEKMTASQIARTLERQRIEMLFRGVPAEVVETRLAEMRGDSIARTQARLKLMFILMNLAERFEIEVTEEDTNARIAEIARQRGERPSALRAELVRQGRLGEIAGQIREHRALDRLVSKARVSEVSAAEWNKLVSSQAASSSTASTRKSSPKTKAASEPATEREDKPAKKPAAKASSPTRKTPKKTSKKE